MRSAELPLLPAGLDLLSSRGSEILRRHIEAYWHARGYAGIFAERYDIAKDGIAFGVRSNIGQNGFPPRKPNTFLAPGTGNIKRVSLA